MTTPFLPVSLEDARIEGLPESFYYINNFITPAEEAQLLAKITTSARWIQLNNRRLQVYPTALTPKNILIPATSLPSWLSNPILPRFADLGIFSSTPHSGPNQCLVNEYQPGQGIMPHEDGDAYAEVVATVSLGAPIVLDIYEKKDNGKRCENARWRILQEERSLLVTRGWAYKGLLHGIEERSSDEDLVPGVGHEGAANWDMLENNESFSSKGTGVERRTRISLTWRDVLKVSRAGSKLFGKR